MPVHRVFGGSSSWRTEAIVESVVEVAREALLLLLLLKLLLLLLLTNGLLFVRSHWAPRRVVLGRLLGPADGLLAAARVALLLLLLYLSDLALELLINRALLVLLAGRRVDRVNGLVLERARWEACELKLRLLRARIVGSHWEHLRRRLRLEAHWPRLVHIEAQVRLSGHWRKARLEVVHLVQFRLVSIVLVHGHRWQLVARYMWPPVWVLVLRVLMLVLLVLVLVLVVVVVVLIDGVLRLVLIQVGVLS